MRSRTLLSMLRFGNPLKKNKKSLALLLVFTHNHTPRSLFLFLSLALLSSHMCTLISPSSSSSSSLPLLAADLRAVCGELPLGVAGRSALQGRVHSIETGEAMIVAVCSVCGISRDL